MKRGKKPLWRKLRTVFNGVAILLCSVILIVSVIALIEGDADAVVGVGAAGIGIATFILNEFGWVESDD